MLRLQRLQTRGDTIIEVLIALAVLGSALSVGYATASKALTTARISQEHSEAQGILESQVELLRQAAPSFATPASDIYTSKTFCMSTNGTAVPLRADFPPSYTRPEDANNDTLAASYPATPSAPYPTPCVRGSGRYYVSIVYTATANGYPDDLFTIYARWDGLSTLGRQQAVMTYKIHQATAGGGSIGGSGTPAPPPSTPPAPTCAATVPTNAFDGCYYSDMNFGTVALDRIDPSINFDWGLGSPGPGVPSDNFSAQWRGNFSFNSGNYTFHVSGDDGVEIFVDGNPVTLSPGNSFSDHSTTAYTGTVNMTAGTHLVTMKYYEHLVFATASLSWAFNPPPPPPSSAITASTRITPFFTSCYYDTSGNPVASEIYKITDGNDATGIVTNCGSINYYVVDLGAYYNIASISVVWGPEAPNISQWAIAPTDSFGASSGALCDQPGSDYLGWSYGPPVNPTTLQAADFRCRGGGTMTHIRYIYVDEQGNAPISLNELRITGTPAP